MLKKTIFRFLLFLFYCNLLCFSTSVTAQLHSDTTTIWDIKTKDGNKYRGKILTKANKRLFVKTESLGTITILKKDIGLRAKQNNHYWRSISYLLHSY